MAPLHTPTMGTVLPSLAAPVCWKVRCLGAVNCTWMGRVALGDVTWVALASGTTTRQGWSEALDGKVARDAIHLGGTGRTPAEPASRTHCSPRPLVAFPPALLRRVDREAAQVQGVLVLGAVWPWSYWPVGRWRWAAWPYSRGS